MANEQLTATISERIESASRWPDSTAHLVFWPIVVIGIAADLLSKWAVFAWLKNVPRNEYVMIDGLFRLVMLENEGAAFGIAKGQTSLLVGVSVVALFVVAGIFLFGRVHQRVLQVALGLFTAGIGGNLYDRAFNEGRVRDFLDFHWSDHHWPAFNIADSMLCVAVGLLLIMNFTSAFSQRPVHRQTGERQGPH